MAVKNFWLLSIADSYLSASLVVLEDDSYRLLSSSEDFSWETGKQSFTSAVDKAIFSAAEKISLPETDEPSSAAFILPPFWVSSEGKITPPKLEIVEDACKKLKLQPLGFIANDETIAEAGNLEDDFPASFLLFHLDTASLNLSLVYLGKVKERFYKNISSPPTPQLLESMLREIVAEGNLPPQIIVFGPQAETMLDDLTAHSWTELGSKPLFLHLPQVELYSRPKVFKIYSQIIASQIDPNSKLSFSVGSDPSPIPSSPADLPEEDLPDSLEETTALDLGFGQTDTLPVSLPPPSPDLPPEPVLPPPKKLPHFNFSFLKKIKLPRLPFLPFLAAFPLLLLFPFFFSKAELIIFVTPYSFDKQIPITLDSTLDASDFSRGLISVQKNESVIETTSSISTTGSLTVGEQAKGQIVIYNKQAKVQQLDKNTLLLDSQGRKFNLANPVQITASTPDLDQGIITLGQTKAVALAVDIGPESNIDSQQELTFDQFSSDLLVAKTVENFSGGSRQQVKAVSDQDQQTLKEKINEDVSQSINEKITQKIDKIGQVINETLQSSNSRIDYNREIGEQAEELSASVSTTVTVFSLKPGQKEEIISAFLSDEPDFAKSQFDADSFSLIFEIKQLTANTATGTLTLKGQSLPQADLPLLTKQISGKFRQKIPQILNQTFPRMYNYQILTNPSFFDRVNPLPFITKNINITVKTESP